MKMNLKDKYKFVFRDDFPSLVINASAGWYEEQEWWHSVERIPTNVSCVRVSESTHTICEFSLLLVLYFAYFSSFLLASKILISQISIQP